jgi:glycosyltransferase involved in cell wall biosynthesis
LPDIRRGEMKIVIATTFTPFVESGSTYIVNGLDQSLKQRGHDVETFHFPFSDRPDEVLEQLTALRLIDLSQFGDRLVTIRTPSHLLKHPNKVAWLLQHDRVAQDWSDTPEDEARRQAILSADRIGLRESSRVFCNSVVAKNRLRRLNSLDAEVLYPPLLRHDQFHCAGYGDYLLYFSRLTRRKRQWLAIESLRYTKTPVSLVIAGASDTDGEPYVTELRNLIHRYQLNHRVTLLPGWVPDDRKLALFSGCLAGLYFPLDDDSCGDSSLEAHASRKAVLTTTDAGGACELIVDGLNGLVLPPDPPAIAEAMDLLYTNRPATQQMGAAGPPRMKELGMNWDHVVERLLS